MNYGKNATKRRVQHYNSKSSKICHAIFLFFCKAVLLCAIVACVVGISAGIGVFKGIIDSDSIPTKERFADIDMKSIKYFYSKNDIVCNLYAQNIQDENIITKLDDFFDNNNYSLVEFIIIPDSFKFMEELGYKCYSKRYIVDYE